MIGAPIRRGRNARQWDRRRRLKADGPCHPNRDASGARRRPTEATGINVRKVPGVAEWAWQGRDLMQAAVAQSAAVARFPAKRAPKAPARRGALARFCESLEIRPRTRTSCA
jgi:hypothetical protein